MASRGPISNKILHPSIYASILQKRSSNIEFFKTLNYHNLKFKKLNLTIISKFFSFFFATSLKNSDFLCWQKRQCKFDFPHTRPQNCHLHWQNVFLLCPPIEHDLWLCQTLTQNLLYPNSFHQRMKMYLLLTLQGEGH